MKTLKIFGIPIFEYGSQRYGAVPERQAKFLSPRFEPSNISEGATLARVQAALREAENGQTFDLFRFYRDVLLSDSHVQAEINTRKLAVLSQPLSILPEDKNNPEDVALSKALMQAKADCENWNAGMIALMESNCGWPVSIVERLYRPATDARPGVPKLQYTLRKFVPVNPQLLCYQWAYLTGGVGLGTASAVQLAQMGPGNTKSEIRNPNWDGRRHDSQPSTQNSSQPAGGTPALPGNPYTIDLERWEPFIKLWPVDGTGRIIYDVTAAEYLDPARHIVHRGHLMGTMRDNWGGPMRAILMWWLFRNLGRGWFAHGMERYGQPFPVAYTDINDPAQVRLLREAFELSRRIGGLVVGEDTRVELQQAMVHGMAQGYETFHRICNDEISKQITGLDSNSKPRGLNAEQDNLLQSVREDVRMFDQLTLNETLTRLLATPFRDLNGLGNGRVKFIWGGLSDADAATFATMLQTMRNAGYELTEESLPMATERTGLGWRRTEERLKAEVE